MPKVEPLTHWILETGFIDLSNNALTARLPEELFGMEDLGMCLCPLFSLPLKEPPTLNLLQKFFGSIITT